VGKSVIMLKIRKSLIFVVVIFLSTIFLAPSGNASAIPKNLAAYKNQLNIWIKSLSSYDFTRINEVSNANFEQFDVGTSTNEVKINLDNSKSLIQTKQSQLDSLKAQFVTDDVVLKSANTTLSQAVDSYNSVNQQFTNITAQYNAAINDRASVVSCQVLKDFGFGAGTCYPENPLNFLVISQYNSLKTQVNSALANWQTALDGLKRASQTYYSDGQAQEVLSGEIDLVSQSISDLSKNLTTLNNYTAQVDVFRQKKYDLSLSEISLKQKISSSIKTLKSNLNSKTFSKTYPSALKIFTSTDSSMKNLEFSAENISEPGIPPVVSSQTIWLPTGYGSNYSSVTRAGPDYGVSWSKYWACTGMCTVGLFVISSNCTNAVVGVNWIDSTQAVVGKSSAFLPSMRVGTVYPLGFTLPSSLDQKKSYSSQLASFQCDP
jgi:hypothetical protein